MFFFVDVVLVFCLFIIWSCWVPIMFKNGPPFCVIFGNPYICWNKFWSISSTDKFIILWKSEKKMVSIDISHIHGGYVEIEKKKKKKGKKKKKQAQVWANLEANSWRLIVSLLHWGVIFQINHNIEKIWWWGMITNTVNSPNNLYLEAKNQNMSRYGGYIYVTLSCNIWCSSGWY